MRRLSFMIVVFLFSFEHIVGSFVPANKRDETESVEEVQKPTDCADVKNQGHNEAGIYEVCPKNKTTEPFCFEVFCDGDGWLVFDRRGGYNLPESYFYRSWASYREGFGNINGEFFLGLDKIHFLLKQRYYTLKVEMFNFNNEYVEAFYSSFKVESEKEKYKMTYNGYEGGNAGNGMYWFINQRFSTYDDHGNGLWTQGCTNDKQGGWWFSRSCRQSNLHGLSKRYCRKGMGMVWEGVDYKVYHLKAYEMKIR